MSAFLRTASTKCFKNLKLSTLSVLKQQQQCPLNPIHCHRVVAPALQDGLNTSNQYSTFSAARFHPLLRNDKFMGVSTAQFTTSVDAARETSMQDIPQMMKEANDLAKTVLKLQAENRNDELEFQEKAKRERNLMIEIFNKELNFNDPETREKHGLNKIHECLKFLGFNDIIIENLEHCGGNLFKIQVENNDLKTNIVNAFGVKARQGIAGGIWIRPDRTQFQTKKQRLLRKEQMLRNEICRLRSDPWRWTIKSSRVVPKIDEIKNDPEAMQRLADELKNMAKMLTEVSHSDKAHRRAHFERKNSIFITNIGDGDDNKSSELETSTNGSLMKLGKLLNAFGVSFSKVKKVEVMKYKNLWGTFPLEVTFKDRETVQHILKEKKNLQDANDTWMKTVWIQLSASNVNRYIDSMQLLERRLRNEISTQKGESPQWVVRSGKVIKLVENDA